MGCIKIYNNQHSINTVESLRYLPANNDVKNLFYEYFDNGTYIFFRKSKKNRKYMKKVVL